MYHLQPLPLEQDFPYPNPSLIPKKLLLIGAKDPNSRGFPLFKLPGLSYCPFGVTFSPFCGLNLSLS